MAERGVDHNMHPLNQLMNPASIAMWGASNNPMKMGTIQLANILETGFRGDVYPIHPTESEVMGVPAFKSVLDVGKPIDLAFMTLPTEVVPQVLDECGRAGIKRAIVISGGFKEAQGDRGKELEREIKEIAGRYGIRFLGPNCVGVANSLVSLNSTTIPMPPFDGRIGLASQSGAYTAMINPYLTSMGIKICQTISVGNEADIDLADCLEYYAEVPEVEAIGLYIETVRRPREFIRAAREAIRRKPVLAMYVGGTEAGSRSSLSHTGALTGPDEVYDGLFRQAGIIRANDMDQMLDMLWALACQPAPEGPRMAVITNSGGPGTSLAYHAEKVGLRVPAFSPELVARLDAVTGKLAFVGNPIDLTFDTNMGLFKQLVEIVFDSGEVDGVFLYGLMGGPDFMVNLKTRFPALEQIQAEWLAHYDSFLEQFAAVPREYAKPLLVMSFISPSSPSISHIIDEGVPIYSSASRAASVMRTMLDYNNIRENG